MYKRQVLSDLLKIDLVKEAKGTFGYYDILVKIQASSEKEISEKEKEKRRQEGIENAKMDLRMKFILDSISEHEEMKFDKNEAAREFVGLAQITGQSPDELIKSPFGHDMYERIVVRKKGDATLDRVVARVFGDPIEEFAAEDNEHVHDENCEHDHS